MSQCEWILYESGHKFFVKGSLILYTFALLTMAWESQTAVLEHFEDDEYYYLYILYFERFGFCALSIWAMLDFRIQFNELLNSVTDKNENKNPYSEVNTCTINDFLFTVLPWILNTMKPHVLKICGTGAKKKKKKKKSFVSPYPTDLLKMTLTQNIFSLKPIHFFFYQNLYFAVRGAFCTILLFLMYFYCKILNCYYFEAF